MSNIVNDQLASGLNRRSHNECHENIKKQNALSAARLMYGNSSSDEEDDIAVQQEALRKRAAAALAAATAKGEASMYDYDGVYETWQKPQQAIHTVDKVERKSRYVEKLLATSQKRSHQLESAWDRKRAKELKEEELANEELYQGKDQFITESYRKRLQERQRWLQDQELKDQQEKDVTKLNKAGFSSSSLLRNVLHGTEADTADNRNIYSADLRSEELDPPNLCKSTVREARSDGSLRTVTYTLESEAPPASLVTGSLSQIKHAENALLEDSKARRTIMVEAREAKLAAARERYFSRVNVAS